MVVATIAAPILAAVLTAALTRAVQNRARVVTYYGHVSAFSVRQDGGGSSSVFTHDVVVRNSGSKTATNVRLGHHFLPVNYNIYPPVESRVLQTTGGAEIVLPSLVPGEEVTVSYLYFPPTTWEGVNSYVKSDEGMARRLTVLLQPQPAKWLVVVLSVLCILGAVAVIYVVYSVAWHSRA